MRVEVHATAMLIILLLFVTTGAEYRLYSWLSKNGCSYNSPEIYWTHVNTFKRMTQQTCYAGGATYDSTSYYVQHFRNDAYCGKFVKDTTGLNVIENVETIQKTTGYVIEEDEMLDIVKTKEEELLKYNSEVIISKDCQIAIAYTPPESDYEWFRCSKRGCFVAGQSSHITSKGVTVNDNALYPNGFCGRVCNDNLGDDGQGFLPKPSSRRECVKGEDFCDYYKASSSNLDDLGEAVLNRFVGVSKQGFVYSIDTRFLLIPSDMVEADKYIYRFLFEVGMEVKIEEQKKELQDYMKNLEMKLMSNITSVANKVSEINLGEIEFETSPIVKVGVFLSYSLAGLLFLMVISGVIAGICMRRSNENKLNKSSGD